MKKIILTSLIAGFAAFSANASDGGLYSETQTTVRRVSANAETIQYIAAPRAAAPVASPCARRASCQQNPVAVKTHTEVIEHYQVFQPVTVYQPVGTFAQRRIIEAAQPCARCGY